MPLRKAIYHEYRTNVRLCSSYMTWLMTLDGSISTTFTQKSPIPEKSPASEYWSKKSPVTTEDEKNHQHRGKITTDGEKNHQRWKKNHQHQLPAEKKITSSSKNHHTPISMSKKNHQPARKNHQSRTKIPTTLGGGDPPPLKILIWQAWSQSPDYRKTYLFFHGDKFMKINTYLDLLLVSELKWKEVWGIDEFNDIWSYHTCCNFW